MGSAVAEREPFGLTGTGLQDATILGRIIKYESAIRKSCAKLIE
jgi:hypothetical protein